MSASVVQLHMMSKKECVLKHLTTVIGNYQQALETYKTIHKRFPENVECKYTN